MTVNLKRLKAERIASGMTQDEVAHKMGWKSRTPYAKRENGLVSIGADELAKITKIFGLPMEKITIFFSENVPEMEQTAQKGAYMIHHYITHYASNGKDYAEAWIQINIFGMCFCLWKKRTTIERLYTNEDQIFFLDEFREEKT